MENTPTPPGGQIPPSEMLACLLLEDREEQTSLVIMRQAGAPLLQNIPYTNHTVKVGKGLQKLGQMCGAVHTAAGHPVPLP